MELDKCICVGATQNEHKPGTGFLRPLFWVLPTGGYKSITSDEFLNRGLLYVSRGYDDVANSPLGTLFEVTVSESSRWIPENPSSAKFSTYKRDDIWKKISRGDIALCSVVDGVYPDFSDLSNNSITVTNVPTSSFFLRCRNLNNIDVLIGPLDSITRELSYEVGASSSDTIYELNYVPPNRPFKHPWGALTESARCVYEIEIDTLPEGWSETASDSCVYAFSDLLVSGNKKLLDLSTNQQVLKWLQDSARKSPLSGKEIIVSKLKEVSEHFSNSDIDSKVPREIYDQRVERLNNMPIEISESEDFEKLLRIYTDTDSGQAKIQSLIEGDLSRYLLQAKSELVEEMTLEVEQQKIELESALDNGIAEKRDYIEELDEEIKRKQDEAQRDMVAELEDKIESLREEYNIIEKVAVLSENKDYLEKNIDELKGKVKAQKETLDEVRVKTSKSVEGHRKDLIGLKLDLDILDGRASDNDSYDREKVYQKPSSYKMLAGPDDDDKRSELLDILYSRMESQGLDFKRSFITKLAISVCQNLVVTLSGKPGSGKTTAASVLAKGFGLVEANKHIHIQVQRGWTSDKDLLGFHNRLTQIYEKDRYGLYDLLVKLQNADDEDSMALVTLDEANLSPLEYYFATFMGSCDDKSTFFTQEAKLKLPEGMRFIATVNNDRTTEILSDRFLDRSPVILTQSSPDDAFNIPTSDIQKQNYKEFSFDDISMLFSPRVDEPLNLQERRVLATIRDEHPIIPIEKRKYKAISNFTSVGRNQFGNNSELKGNPQLRALDEAILAYLLPKIAGQGSMYRERLQNLAAFLEKNDLLESSAVINHIVRNSQYEAYSFFS
jgi:hypothetical protein